MKKLMAVLLSFLVVTGVSATAFCEELVVYSARKEHLVKPLFDAYTAETGVKINYLTGKAPVLMQRIKAEGKNTPADLLITVDAGNLWHAASVGILSPVVSETLSANVPSHLKDPENRWFGLSIRARTIAYNTRKVKPSDLSTYANLGAPQWKGKLLLRTSKKVYNQSLVAMLIADNGEAEAEKIVESWVGNLAVPPFSSDTKVLEAIAAGQGDVGIVNTYYYGRLIKKNPELPLALFWPDQDGKGVHVNVSGAGVTANAKHREQAVKFLEWLSSEKAQNLFADSNMEYPVNPKVESHATVAGWGEFNENTLNLNNAGLRQADAIRLMDRAGYK